MNFHHSSICAIFIVLFPFLIISPLGAADLNSGLITHWELTADCRDSSPAAAHGTNHGVTFDSEGWATFDGLGNFIEVPDSKSLALGKGDFSIAVWVNTEKDLDDVLGDILSKYDPATRKGINLGLMNYVGNTSSQSNHRNLLFGIDNGDAVPKWTDCGRPGQSQMIAAMAVFGESLYVGTWEPAEGHAGHVYRYDGPKNGTPAKWIDCGSPDACNAVWSLCEHDGKLYAGSAFYNGAGSALPVSPNKNPGGKVFRYEGGSKWADCGKIGDVYTTTGLVTFKGDLYATTCDSYGCPKRTAACYRYDGEWKWSYVGTAGGRLGAFCVYNGNLYATVYGKDGFARYDGGEKWTPLGAVPNTSQTYSAVIHQGKVCVGTWPTAGIFRYEGPNRFAPLGSLGSEKEVMAMAVYNGKLYAGTLPTGEVYRCDGPNNWTLSRRLDNTPDVRYRRIWSMAVFDGKLFAGTLPSGHVWSLEAGKCVTLDRALPPGKHHIAAVKEGGILKLFLDGECVAESEAAVAEDYSCQTDAPLRIGFGEHDYFNGKMKDLRVYNRALTTNEVLELTK